MEVVEAATAGRVLSEAPAKVTVTVEDGEGNEVYTLKEIPLVQFSSDYISTPLSLKAGSYTLTEFVVSSSLGTSIYSTPLEGSELEYLVEDALPISFTVGADAASKVVPEVISTASQTPEAFGYFNFSFNAVSTVEFLMAVFVYDAITENYVLSTGDLTVSANENDLFSGTTTATTNQVEVRSGYDSYSLSVAKSGYTTWSQSFTEAELQALFSNPLEVVLIAE